jgi:gliding motility-associated-like protein
MLLEDMKKIFVLLLLLVTSTLVKAGHIAGGEMYYKYIGPGSQPNTFKYEITLRLFRECNPPPGPGGTQVSQMPGSVRIGVFVNSNPTTHLRDEEVARTVLEEITLSKPGACIVNAPQVCYQVGNFTKTIDLPASSSGYVLSFQTCCRTNGIMNISGSSVGATYSAEIPPNTGANAIDNSSAVFALKDTTLVCKDLNFTLDFSATDPDLDSLSYSFCAAYDGGSTRDATPVTPSNPPYNAIFYGAAFGGTQPLGAGVTIDTKTGLISGNAPGAGSYVINVCVSEFRNGKLISVHRKDFTLKIGDCSLTEAKLSQPGYPTICKNFAYTFENLSTSSNIASYSWEFFDPASGASNTSTDPRPTHTYSDTGVYKIKLKVQNNAGCSDSSTSTVRVYPGFTPDFQVNGSCFLNPFQFTDKSVTRYGTVNSWRWNFGDPSTEADTAVTKNASYKYPGLSQPMVQLIAGNTNGCIDTVLKQIDVFDFPFLNLPFKDTLICSIDTLPLKAEGTGTFTWSPAYNIINPGTATPSVYPKTTTSYIVTLNENGCISKDTIKVNVLDFITANAGADTSICIRDSIVLRPQTQGLQFAWTPATGLSDPAAKTPTAGPLVSTRYLLTVNLGKCQASDAVDIKVAAYPQAYAGADTAICFGDEALLRATIVGSSFNWSPLNSLQASNTLTPVASPAATTNYILKAYDTLGCPKPFIDTVVVRVVPPIRAFAGNDTSVVATQPLQLNATGGTEYAWSPNFGMTNSLIPNPIVSFGPEVGTITYTVKVSVPEGCFNTDDINIKVFKTGPDIFVPSAFTPNNDNKNDILKPIAVGMKSINYFRVYNRWGQMLFSTGEIGKGWDGRFGGVEQGSGTYVYTAEATDYQDKKILKKGTVVLIR